MTMKMVVGHGTAAMVVLSLLFLLLSFPRQAVPQECLYVTSGSTEMAVLRPPATEPLISFPAGTETTGVAMDGDVLYVASGSESTINMYDLANNLTLLGPFVVFSELFYLEQILIHDGMMYVATDDYPYVLKVPTPGLTNSSDFNATQWQPTGGGVALYWRPAVNLQGSAIKGAAWGLQYTNASGVGPGVLVSTQANELYLLSVDNAGYDNVSLVYSDTSAFGPLRWGGMDVDSGGSLYLSQGRGGRVLQFNSSALALQGDFGTALDTLIYDVKLSADGLLYLAILSSVGTMTQDGTFTTLYTSDVGVIYFEFHACPMLALPSPSPAAVAPSSGVDSLVVVLATVLPSIFVGLLLLLCLVAALFFAVAWKDKRRKWHDEHDDRELESMEVGKVKYSYREIDPQDLQLGTLLGEGGFGKVYRGMWRGAPVAVKIFEQVELDQVDNSTLHTLRREAEMLEKLSNHPCVVSFVGAVTKGDVAIQGMEKCPFALVLEFYPHGSLYDVLVAKRLELPFHILVRMARDIALGILHLHKEKVIHRDIATRNVLVGDNYSVHISDFGLARAKKDEVDRTTSNYGAIKWMAPEALLRGEYSEASDCFSYGVLLWEMVTRKSPWNNVDPTQIAIAVGVKNTRLRIPPVCDPVFRRIMKSCWKQNPQKRMKMEEICSMLEQYYADLAKYAGEDWMDDEYEDGEIEHSSTSSSVVSHAQTSTSSPTGKKRRPSNQHSKLMRQVGNTSNNSSEASKSVTGEKEGTAAASKDTGKAKAEYLVTEVFALEGAEE